MLFCRSTSAPTAATPSHPVNLTSRVIRDSKLVQDRFRDNPERALEVLRSFWPARRLAALTSVISRSMSYAHFQSDACWSVTLFEDMLTLNVGQVRVLDADNLALTLYLEGPTGIPKHSGVDVVDSPSKRFCAALDVPCFTIVVQPQSVSSLSTPILTKHHKLIASAAAAKRSSPFRRSYSPAVVEILRKRGKRSLEHPSWFAPNRVEISESSSLRGLFGTAETNRLVEAAAINVVTANYRALGWTVRSVEMENVGYDLHCVNGRREMHVEVKGLSGEDLRFVITANEHDKAFADSQWKLAVVQNATSSTPRIEEFSGSQYEELFHVQPLTFGAKLRPSRSRK